jgi:hypothetical protein
MPNSKWQSFLIFNNIPPFKIKFPPIFQLQLKKERRPLWTWIKRKLRKPDYLPARIDYYARIWMPIGFLFFNCAYWMICLFMAAQQQMSNE